MPNVLYSTLWAFNKVAKVVDGTVKPFILSDVSITAGCTDILGDLWVIAGTNVKHYIEGVLIPEDTTPIGRDSVKISFGYFNSTTFILVVPSQTDNTMTIIYLQAGGKGLRVISSEVKAVGTTPIGATIDSLGNIYVANLGSNSVMRFTNTAGYSADPFIFALGAGTTPYDVCVDSTDGVWISCPGNNSLKKIASPVATTLVITIALGASCTIYSMCADKLGNMYARHTGTTGQTLKKYAGTALVLTTAVMPDTGMWDGIARDGICCDPLGNVYVGTGAGYNMMLPAGGVIANFSRSLRYEYNHHTMFGACMDTVRGMIYFIYGGIAGYPATIAQKLITFNPSVTSVNAYDICVNKIDGSLYVCCYATASSTVLYHIIDGDVPIITQIPLTGALNPMKMVCDDKGHIWIPSYSSALLFEVEGDAVVGTYPIGSARDICIDDFGDIWLTYINTGITTIRRLSADKLSVRNSITVVASALGVCSDGLGNLYVTSGGGSIVSRISNLDAPLPTSPTVTTIATPASPFHPFVDSKGTVYVPCSTTANCLAITLAGVLSSFTVGLTPQSGCCDSEDNAWVTNTGATTITCIRAGATVEPAIGVGIASCGPKCICCVYIPMDKPTNKLFSGGL